MSKIKDITGQRFKSLVAIKRVGSDVNGHSLWLCKCDCGTDFITQSNKLLTGNTGTCGCRNGHGKRYTRIYRTWTNMKQRCLNPSQKNYQWYGAKGIDIFDKWVESFELFYNWAISNGYKDDLTIDRIDHTKGYYPENCRWVTISENVKRKVITDETKEKLSQSKRGRIPWNKGLKKRHGNPHL